MTHPQATTRPLTPQAPPKARPPLIPRAVKAASCAAGMACTGAQVRPPAEDCPAATLQQMRSVGLRPGMEMQIYLDINQPGPVLDDGNHATVRSGPITSHAAWSVPNDRLHNARILGHLWVTKDRVYGRYGTLLLSDNTSVPVCMQLVADGLGAEPEAGHQPPVGRVRRVLGVRVVKRFD